MTTTVRVANLLAHGVTDSQGDAQLTNLALALQALAIGLEGDIWDKTLQKIRTGFEGAAMAIGL